MANLDIFFKPKSIAVIGASTNPNKVGHVILKNIMDGGYPGRLTPINPNATEILGKKTYKDVTKVPYKIDLAIISIPAALVLKTVTQLHKKNIRHTIIVTAGFSENGNHDLEKKLTQALNKHNITCIGVNCLGVYDAHNKLDTLFLPRYRLERPEPGSISFVCQSGAVGSAILDIATSQGHKFSKFISYGNATQTDESDLLEYLGNDPTTKVICLYVEGIKNGQKFYDTLRRVNKKKPVIALKGGLTDAGSKATLSHTGSLAGNKEVYKGIFKQTGTITAHTLEELFTTATLVENGIKLKGNNVQIITNGGGYGIISTDKIVETENLRMAQLAPETVKRLKKIFPPTVTVGNPMDLVGDATTQRYQTAIKAALADPNVNALLLIALYQTPLLTTDIVEIITEAQRSQNAKNATYFGTSNSKTPRKGVGGKPIIVISTGGEFTEILSKSLQQRNIPTYQYPTDAIQALDKIAWYEQKKKTL